MGKLNVPSQPSVRQAQYRELLGVDYLRDHTEVDGRRSPKMVNMISDLGGNPIKRDGYRVVGIRYDAILSVRGEKYGVSSNLSSIVINRLEMGNNHVLEETHIKTIDGKFGKANKAFSYQKYIYILSQNAILRYDTVTNEVLIAGTGEKMMSKGKVGESEPINDKIIPSTVISLQPNGLGGTALDSKNLASIYQTVTYLGDGETKDYKIPNYDKVGSYVKAEVLDGEGKWKVVNVGTSASQSIVGKTLDGKGTDSFRVVDNKVTFTTAPSKPLVSGEPNVRITFAPFSTEQVDGVNRGYYNKTLVEILGSRTIIYFNSRLFIAVESRTHYSDVDNPFSIPDLNYFDVDNNIMCYTRSSSYLAIITKDNGRNTIFLASEIKDNNITQYSVKASNAGVGAVSQKCIGIVNDEPTFLSRDGLFGIMTNWQSEKYAVNRSARINRALCGEEHLENAVGCAWQEYFYVAINSRMYVLDSRHKSTDRRSDRSYEGYFFENIPNIQSMFVIDNRMYFADESHTYTWNEDLSETARYLDNAKLVDGSWTGEPVKAMWCSAFDDDGYPSKLKTLQKKGSFVTLVPHYKTGCELTLVKNGDERQYVGEFTADMMSFERIDFSRFVFNGNTATADFFMKKKIKKYKRLQIILENNKAEPFGITNVVKSYTIGDLAKR
jgi:hypothetical protein